MHKYSEYNCSSSKLSTKVTRIPHGCMTCRFINRVSPIHPCSSCGYIECYWESQDITNKTVSTY